MSTRARPTRYSLAQLLKLAEMATRARLEQDLRPFRLSSGQLLILVRVEREGAITPADLARSLYQTAQSIGKLYPPLEQRGLLQRRTDESNARRILLELTPAAHDLLARVRVEIVDVDVEIADKLGPNGAEALEALLLKLI